MENEHADVYFCGPVPFMKFIYRSLKHLGVAKEQVHFEFFGPARELEEEETTILEKR